MTIENDRAGHTVERAELARLYLAMARIRAFEDAVMQAFHSGEIRGTTHLAAARRLFRWASARRSAPHDCVAATYRGHGAALALGCDPEALFAEFLGREGGICGGRGGSMNVIDLDHRLLGCFGIVGGSIGAATGAALAAELTGDGSVAAAFFGDGALNQAYFHECMNLAGVRRLPIVYACENNLYGEWTHMSETTAGGRLAARADAYGMPWEIVDGNDVVAVREAARAGRRASPRGRRPDVPRVPHLPPPRPLAQRPGQVPPARGGRRAGSPRPAARGWPNVLPATRPQRCAAEAEREMQEALERAAAAPADPAGPATAPGRLMAAVSLPPGRA